MLWRKCDLEAYLALHDWGQLLWQVRVYHLGPARMSVEDAVEHVATQSALWTSGRIHLRELAKKEVFVLPENHPDRIAAREAEERLENRRTSRVRNDEPETEISL